MTKWEVARYLIDAKKCIDSIWYIADNTKSLSNINLRKKTNELLREFYIFCCVVLDETHNKKALCQTSEAIQRVYYERDKDKAHKDSNYKPIKYSSLYELRDIMKEQLFEVYLVCKYLLPENITLDYVPHDKELFRLVHAITTDIEEKIKKSKYPLYDNHPSDSSGIKRTIFQDTEDMRNMTEEKKKNMR